MIRGGSLGGGMPGTMSEGRGGRGGGGRFSTASWKDKGEISINLYLYRTFLPAKVSQGAKGHKKQANVNKNTLKQIGTGSKLKC